MRWTVLTLRAAQPRDEITVTMPDGSERKGKAWETSPMDIAKEVSKSLSERIVIAKVRWQLFFVSNDVNGSDRLTAPCGTSSGP